MGQYTKSVWTTIKLKRSVSTGKQLPYESAWCLNYLDAALPLSSHLRHQQGAHLKTQAASHHAQIALVASSWPTAIFLFGELLSHHPLHESDILFKHRPGWDHSHSLKPPAGPRPSVSVSESSGRTNAWSGARHFKQLTSFQKRRGELGKEF